MFNFLIAVIVSLYPQAHSWDFNLMPKKHIVSEHIISLDKRYDDRGVNDIFKENILLNLQYMEGKIHNPQQINWNNIGKPFSFELKLAPSETFSFHDDVLPPYQGKISKTTNTHFNFQDGFKSDGYIFGDGVCHLASIIYWVARDAGMRSEAPTSHNFANIPQIPPEYGVSIFYNPGEHDNNARQNLYITNNLNKEVAFNFDYNGQNLKVSLFKFN